MDEFDTLFTTIENFDEMTIERLQVRLKSPYLIRYRISLASRHSSFLSVAFAFIFQISNCFYLPVLENGQSYAPYCCS